VGATLEGFAMDLGFTNDEARFRAAQELRDAAVADGWSIRPTYGSEDIGRASTLDRDGFKMLVLTREISATSRKWKYEAAVHIWGPDGLSIDSPQAYDWNLIRGSIRRCGYCKADDVDTQRVGFAGRCCAKCLPAQRARIETPGWTS
jgi:hypothetical protein